MSLSERVAFQSGSCPLLQPRRAFTTNALLGLKQTGTLFPEPHQQQNPTPVLELFACDHTRCSNQKEKNCNQKCRLLPPCPHRSNQWPRPRAAAANQRKKQTIHHHCLRPRRKEINTTEPRPPPRFPSIVNWPMSRQKVPCH